MVIDVWDGIGVTEVDLCQKLENDVCSKISDFHSEEWAVG